MSKPALGFIGLGNMGGPMSIRLINAGYEVFVYDRDEGALARAVSAGAKQLTSIKAVADQVETVFLSLPTPEIVDAVCLQGAVCARGAKLSRWWICRQLDRVLLLRLQKDCSSAAWSMWILL